MDEMTSLMISQIKEIDERDEQQILAELAGEAVEDFIYEIPQGKNRKRTVKLSWAGTREMGRARGNISLSDPIISETDGYVRIVIKATDLKRNFSVFGGCHQMKQQKVKTFDGSGKSVGEQLQDDAFYFTKALSKAQRNVIQSLIPASFMARVVDKFLVASGKQPLKQLPKPQPSKPRIAKELPALEPGELQTLPELELLAYNRWHIQPAEMYKQLNVERRSDCKQTPWECFVVLKEIYEGE